MPLRSDWSGSTCAIAHAADTLADPWVLLVLRELFSGRDTFDALRDATGAADSVLSRRLRLMTEKGILAKRASGGYALTSAGEATLPILHAYARHSAAVDPDGPEGPWGLQVRCARCGELAASADWCVTCGDVLDAAHTTWSRPSMGGEPFAVARAEVGA